MTDYFKDKPVQKVYLFGSYARGEADKESDVDLLLELNKEAKLSYFTLGGYLYDMENMFNKKVDLVLKDTLSNDRIATIFIERQKQLLYERLAKGC